MLINLGLGSMIGTMTGITTPVLDAYKVQKELLTGPTSLSSPTLLQLRQSIRSFESTDCNRMLCCRSVQCSAFVWSVSVCCCIVAFFCGLLFVQRSGNYFVTMFDDYSAGLPLTVVVILENISVSWVYGAKRLAGASKLEDFV